MLLSALITFVICYLLGNLNGSVILSRMVANDDVRRHGSGNAGFTNFFRQYGGAVSLIVLAIDGLKAALACIIGGAILGRLGYHLEGMLVGAVAVSLGHDFPALLGFRGGKGIICGFCALLTIDWRIALVVVIVFGITYFLTYYVSLSSILGAVTYGTGFAVVYHRNLPVMLMGMFIAGLAIFMHRENIKRLIHGKESKTNFFKKGEKK